jgi:Domain of unknown function (DUF4252)
MKLIFARLRQRSILVAALLACFATPVFAQNARLELKNLEKLSALASDVTDVSLDGDLLQMAANFTAKGGEDTRKATDMLRNLKGIYVKSFEFDKPNQYSAADVEAIRSQLAVPGWKKIVSTHSKTETNEIYLMKDSNNKVLGMAILTAEPQELTVVNIVGQIDMEKLGELSGKFGVPNVDVHQDKDKEKNKDKKSSEGNHEEE